MKITEDGKVSGSGSDSAGEFTIEGILNGKAITYQQTYTSIELVTHYQGEMNEEMTFMQGEWGMNAETKENKFELRKC